MFFLGLNDSKLACIPRGRLLAWLFALGVAGTVSAAQNSRAENAFYSDQQGHSGREHRGEIEADLTTDQENKSERLKDRQSSQVLPIISLKEGWNLNRALSTPDWFELNASILSQNNASFSSPPVQPTSSNLINLGFRLMPLKAVSNLSPQQQKSSVHEQHDHQPFESKIAINALFTQRAGQILSSSIPNQLNTQWNFGNGPIARLNYLNLEYQAEGELISMVKLGKLMQAQDFTVNPIQCYFSSFGLCGWAEGVPSMIDIPGNPFNSYGAVVAFGDSNKANLRYGIYQIAPNTFAPKYHGMDFRFNQGNGVAHFAELRVPIVIDAQIPVQLNQQTRALKVSSRDQANAIYQSNLPAGTMTLGGWFGSGSYQAVADLGSAESQNNGAYGILSLKIPGFSLGLDHRVFLSGGVGLNPNVQDFLSGGQAGLVIEGLFPQRPFDTFSVGTSYASFNSDYFLPGLDPDTYQPGTEWSTEVNYSFNLNQSIKLMPNVQLIMNRGGDPDASPAFVAGFQVWLFF
ncbi:carbohydrate-selective porin/ OprB family protein [Synechococcus sp. NOUM97013]|nr:carbohydrate-selective porin/ OprB family protein [Synechococcus sp. NOUM97013]